MSDSLNNKELIAVGHEFARTMGSDTPIIDIAKIVTRLAERLDSTTAALGEMAKHRDALGAENAALKSAIDEHSNCFTACQCCGTEHDCSHDDICRVLNETPATDSFLAEVRAQGVEMFAESLPSIGDTEVNTYEDGVKAAFETIQRINAPLFSAQLRQEAAQ